MRRIRAVCPVRAPQSTGQRGRNHNPSDSEGVDYNLGLYRNRPAPFGDRAGRPPNLPRTPSLAEVDPMNDDASRWLIRRGPAARPVDEYLHEPSHMAFEWSSDRSVARTFASRADAERFGRAMLASAFHAVAG